MAEAVLTQGRLESEKNALQTLLERSLKEKEEVHRDLLLAKQLAADKDV